MTLLYKDVDCIIYKYKFQMEFNEVINELKYKKIYNSVINDINYASNAFWYGIGELINDDTYTDRIRIIQYKKDYIENPSYTYIS